MVTGSNTTAIIALSAAVTALATGIGAVYAAGQFWMARRTRRADRVVQLHAEFAAGDIGFARARFSELMWRVGEKKFGRNIMWRPSWDNIYPPSPGGDDAVNASRFLGRYPEDMSGSGVNRPLYDLRQVLWCLGRVNSVRKNEKKALDAKLLISALGWEVIWWKLACDRLDRERGGILEPLDELAKWVDEQRVRGRDWDWMNGRKYDPHLDFLKNEDYSRREISSGFAHGSVQGGPDPVTDRRIVNGAWRASWMWRGIWRAGR